MKVDPACFPCALRRMLATAGRITDDPWLHHKLLGKSMSELAELGRDGTPAEMMHMLNTLLSKTLGSTDPFHKDRDAWFEELGGLGDKIREAATGSSNPLETALIMAARANVFDDECLTQREVRDELRTALEHAGEEGHGFACSDVDLFLEDLARSERLLFLHDSGPELPFDRVLIEELVRQRPELQIVSVARHQRILLDATREDIEHFGIHELPGVVEVVDPGIPALGIPLNECSREFREHFEGSDLVLAKGQAHCETIEDPGKPCYFLLRCKCAVMAKNQGVAVGELAFVKS